MSDSGSDEWALPKAAAPAAAQELAHAAPCEALDQAAAPCEEAVVPYAAAGHPARKPFLPADFPAPAQRSALEGAFVAARMRERWLEKKNGELRSCASSSVAAAVAHLHSSGVLSRRKNVTAVAAFQKAVGETSLVFKSSTGRHLSAVTKAPMLLEVSYAVISRRNELAKHYGLDPKQVSDMKMTTASCEEEFWENTLGALSSFFESGEAEKNLSFLGLRWQQMKRK